MPNLELIDIVHYSEPNVFALDVGRTASRLRTAGGSPNNYDMAISPISNIVTGLQKLEDLERYWRSHKSENWHKHLVDVGRRIYEVFSADPCKWYPTGRKPVDSAGGLRVKTAIRGVKVSSGQAYPCLINPRASVFLDEKFGLPFVARGLFELHVRDEFNSAGPMIVDLGKFKGVRANRVHYPEEKDMVSVDQFESILQKFNEALLLAGIAKQMATTPSDLFKPIGV